MDAVEDIKARLNIEDVIGEYVQLKRAGRNFKGLSPFSSERSPSFMVSPEKQIWHDFSSGKGGSMFSFVMEMEGVDFRGALELLARKAGVDLEQYRGSRGSGNAQHKERLYAALEAATHFYQVQFSKTKAAYEYVLGKRQFSKETALEWRLGFAPEAGPGGTSTVLTDFLIGKGFTVDELKKAGLTTQRYRGMGDMFRGRIMIPLQDPQGRVVGFTARLLKDNPDAPKYLNTPQTMLYDKSRHVYGLHLAKEAIRKTGFVVLVEGNLDVIASHQAGIRQVVATAGTAMTEPNLKTLSRFTEDVRLCFDADKAGVAATERAIPIASKVGVSLSVITIPSGKDPDELIKQSKETWQEIIGQSQYALDWLMGRYGTLLDISTAKGKKEFTDIILPIVRALQDSVEQDHYLNELAGALGVSRGALDTKLTKQRSPAQGNSRVQEPQRIPAQWRSQSAAADPAASLSPTVSPRVSIDYQKTQDHLVALLLLHPQLRTEVPAIQKEMFTRNQARYIFRFLTKHNGYRYQGGAEDAAAGPEGQLLKGLNSEQVQSLQDYAKILVLQYEELYGDVESVELIYEIARLQARLIEQYIKHEKQNLAIQLADADEETTRQLLTKARDLDTLFKQVQGGKRG
jgi:DNA primase